MEPETTTPIDSLAELTVDRYYRYAHADVGDPAHTFRVDRSLESRDLISYHYRDGYVADLPVETVRAHLDAGKLRATSRPVREHVAQKATSDVDAARRVD